MIVPTVGAVGATDDGTLGLAGAVPDTAGELRAVPAVVLAVTLAAAIVRTVFRAEASNVGFESSADDIPNTTGLGQISAAPCFDGGPSDPDVLPHGRDIEFVRGLWINEPTNL